MELGAGLQVDGVRFCLLDLSLGVALRGSHPRALTGAKQGMQTTCLKTQVTAFHFHRDDGVRGGALPLPFAPLLPCPQSA